MTMTIEEIRAMPKVLLHDHLDGGLRPATIVELGTGLGASAFAMALAARLSGEGHVFTIDDLSAFSDHPTLLAELTANLRAPSCSPMRSRKNSARTRPTSKAFSIASIPMRSRTVPCSSSLPRS